MTNITTFMEGNYNLTKIIASNPIDNPAGAFSTWNIVMNGYGTIILIAVIGITLFLIMRKNDNVKDTEAAVYSGYIISIAGLFLALINIDGVRLLEWKYLFIIWVITGIAVLLDKVNGRY